jgi:predicted lipoprotein with Yx(FWY)xxD motif
VKRQLVTAATAALVGAALAAPAGSMGVPAPAIKMKTAQFGNVLATRGQKALYYWSVENNDFKVHCTGACARAWPPLIVKSRASVHTRITGIRGTFGVIRRPDGRLQLTHNRLPVYTYAHEGPKQVLCDNVGGWFVVRV